MTFSLLIATTCMACSDNNIQVGLEKVDSQKKSTVSVDQKKSIYIELDNTESDEEELSSTELEETVEKKHGELLKETYNETVNHNTNSTVDEVLTEQIVTPLTESDDTLESIPPSISLTVSTNSSESLLVSISGSTSFEKNPDGFGFTIDLSADYLFQFDQDILTEKAKVALQSIIMLYRQYDGIGIDIAGHTDSKGSSSYNLMLSQRRANSIKQWFELEGIDASSITAIGYGETQPLAPNTNSNTSDLDGRMLNRRINIAVKTKLTNK